MKQRKTKNKIIAACLAFLMVFVNIPISSVYSDDSIKDMKTFDNIIDYIQATSELISDHPCDLDNILYVDVNNDVIVNENGDFYEVYDEVLSSALNEEVVKAEDILNENGYKVVEVEADTISIENPYQTRRIIIEADNLTTGNGAEKILNYKDEYVLQYETIQETMDAYKAYKADPSLKEVYLDLVISYDEEADEYKDIDTFYPVNPDELENGLKDHYSWGVATMGLDKMQDNLYAEDYDLEDVIVAVIDSGVNYNNKYLENRILATGYNFIEGNDEVMDDNGHGTHVSGIVCDGTTNNVKILPVKVLNKEGKGSLLYVKTGILYAIENGADVINLSLSAEDPTHTITYLESVFQTAIDNNVVVCVSAGNDSGDAADYYPASSSKVITVGALDTLMNKAYYSNSGEEIDFAVPGSSIASTYQDKLAYKSGTSMASPHVAAAAALLKTWNKDLTVNEIKEIFIDNCIDLGTEGKDNYFGYGCINLANFDTTRTCNHEYIANITKQATCVEDGVVTYKCKKCGDSYEETIKATGHDYKAEVVEATCLTEGYTTYTCANCGDSFVSDRVPVLGHSYESEVTKQATCEENGEITYTCSRCEDSYTEEIPALGHNYESEVTKEPTHFEDGLRTYTCKNCNDVYTEVIPKEEHVYTVSTIAPSCLEQGYDLHLCEECGYSYKDNYTDTLGHDPQLYDKLEPTCEEDGYEIYRCSRCGEETKTVLQAKGHNFTKEVVEPTCTTEGYTTYTCTNEKCGASYISDYVPALGHKYIDTVIEPTCTEGGYTTHKCSVCEDEYTDNITQAIGHRYMVEITPATCDKDGVIKYTCENCGHSYETTIKAQGHAYYKVTKDPTCTEKGYVKHVCNVCEYSYTEKELEALGHDYVETIIPSTCIEKGYTLHKCSRCGDEFKDNYTELAEHKYIIADKKEATCLLDGYIKYECKDCHDSYELTIPASGHKYSVEIISPTCTTEGYTLQKCDNCGEEIKTNHTKPLGHNYEQKITKEASCGVEGEITYTCSRCGDSYTEKIPALTHNYKITIVNPTCTEEGYTLHECEYCKDSYKDNFVEKIPHEYVGEITIKPTHNSDGEIKYTCKYCGDSYIEKIEKTPHELEAKVVAPTCTEKGYTLYTCKDKDCGYSYKDNYIDALGHNYEAKITKEATCKENGEITYTCSRCGDSYTEEIQKLEHNYTSEVIAPTCTEKGYTLYTCSNCGDTYKDNFTDVISHNYKEVNKVDPTCAKEGKIVYECEYCGDSYEVSIDKLPHKYVDTIVDPTCTSEGYTIHECEYCGDSYKDTYTDKIAHNESEWIIDSEAQCEKDGHRHKECTVCHEVLEEEIIPATGHNYIESVVKPTVLTRGYTLHKCEYCGDSYKDNYVECTSPLVSTIYKAIDSLTSFILGLFH